MQLTANSLLSIVECNFCNSVKALSLLIPCLCKKIKLVIWISIFRGRPEVMHLRFIFIQLEHIGLLIIGCWMSNIFPLLRDILHALSHDRT